MSNLDIDRIKEETTEPTDRVKGKKNRKRRAIVALALILVVVAVSVIGFSVYSKKSYKAVVEAYIEAHIAADYEPVLEIRSGYYDAAIIMKDSETVEALITNTQTAMKNHKKNFKAVLGDDYAVTYEILSAEVMDRSAFEAMVNRFTIGTYRASNEMKEAMIVDVQLTAKNEIDEKNEYLTLILTRESDGWKVLGVEGDYS